MIEVSDTLIKRCLAADQRAWDELFRTIEISSFRMAMDLCHNHEDAADVVQVVALHVLRSLRTYRRTSDFGGWLYRIVYHAFLDTCVRPKYRGDLRLESYIAGTDVPLRESLVDPRPQPEQQALRDDLIRRTGSAYLGLPRQYREMLRLHVMEGRRSVDIERDHGISGGTVRSRVYRARKLLRERVGEG